MTTRRRLAVFATGIALFAGLLTATFVVPFGLLAGRSAEAEIVADLSDHLVAITTGFTGARVLLFGAREAEGDVVVVVRGPRRPMVVRRKGRIAGIWVNEAEMRFQDVPAYYTVASNVPLETIPDSVRARHELGSGFVRMVPPEPAARDEVMAFRAALIRNMQGADLYYVPEPAPVAFLGDTLFRTNIILPANAPVGLYEAAIFLIRDDDVVSAQSTPLQVSKIGFEAWVFDFAHRHALAYGVLAILIAVVAGWLASAIFRKD
ncbi:MAG: hypothetical protein EA406_01095 [Rhodospirillales bacterium]|nr:MAG: hypothetical protein EA406_01095 [Rhodospirillales bacterium]